MEETGKVVVFITAASSEEAREIARLLVERRRAACVSILPKVESLFWWQEQLDSATESLLVAKTRASLLPDVVSIVKEVHSYEVPEVVAVPIVGGNPDYLRWMDITCG